MRRRENKLPLLAGLESLAYKPSDETLRLASQLAHGLRSDKVANPREIKRFLNAFSVRQHIAQVRGLSIRPDVIAKLLLLEDRYRSDFENLASTPDTQRPALLHEWESWAKSKEKTPPAGVSEQSKDWASAEPSLAEEPIGPYLTLAASLAVMSVSVPMDNELAAILARLIGASEADRRSAMTDLGNRSVDDKRSVLEALFSRARLADDVTLTVQTAVAIADQTPELAEEAVAGIQENCWMRLDAGNAVDIAKSELEPMKALARKLAADSQVPADVRQAVKLVMEGNQ